MPSHSAIILFGGSFNPPGIHHRTIAGNIPQDGEQLVIVPGGYYKQKACWSDVSPPDRKKLVELGFAGLENTEFDFYDLDRGVYTPTWELQQRYAKQYPHADIWHAVGPDLVVGGAMGKSEIQRLWHRGPEVWDRLQFLVLSLPDFTPPDGDLPPHARRRNIPILRGRSTEIRERIARGEPFGHLVLPEVYRYIAEHRLYGYQHLPVA
ncbi:MAG: hypothetical protein Q8Q39_02950 [bacterium]|nr:hypothetical protein [bacterium]